VQARQAEVNDLVHSVDDCLSLTDTSGLLRQLHCRACIAAQCRACVATQCRACVRSRALAPSPSPPRCNALCNVQQRGCSRAGTRSAAECPSLLLFCFRAGGHHAFVCFQVGRRRAFVRFRALVPSRGGEAGWSQTRARIYRSPCLPRAPLAARARRMGARTSVLWGALPALVRQRRRADRRAFILTHPTDLSDRGTPRARCASSRSSSCRLCRTAPARGSG
jgi:hypothetical protein